MTGERLIRWAITGVLGLIVDVAQFNLYYWLIGSVFIANAIALPISTTVSYLLHHRWSFSSTTPHARSATRFVTLLLGNYLLNSLLVIGFLTIGLSPLLAKLAPVPIQAPLSFLVMNLWVFGTRRKHEEPVPFVR